MSFIRLSITALLFICYTCELYSESNNISQAALQKADIEKAEKDFEIELVKSKDPFEYSLSIAIEKKHTAKYRAFREIQIYSNDPRYENALVQLSKCDIHSVSEYGGLTVAGMAHNILATIISKRRFNIIVNPANNIKSNYANIRDEFIKHPEWNDPLTLKDEDTVYVKLLVEKAMEFGKEDAVDIVINLNNWISEHFADYVKSYSRNVITYLSKTGPIKVYDNVIDILLECNEKETEALLKDWISKTNDIDIIKSSVSYLSKSKNGKVNLINLSNDNRKHVCLAVVKYFGKHIDADSINAVKNIYARRKNDNADVSELTYYENAIADMVNYLNSK